MENLREQKGKVIAQTRQIKRLDDGFAVQSQNSKRFYFVDRTGKCTCPDCQSGLSERCKHAFAVQYFLQKITRTEQGVKVETKRLTYPQAWSAYNKSQETEKERFLELLNDLIEQPTEQGKRGRGQPKISQHDLIFASALKVYSQFSLRRFMTDLKEAKEKGFIQKKPCFASVGHFMQEKQLTKVLQELINQSALPLKTVETAFAVDSSGFRTTKFNEYCRVRHDTNQKHEFLKAHALVGTKTNIVCSVRVNNEGDSPNFPELVEETSNKGFNLQEVSADKAYSSRENYEIVAGVGGQAFIPFKQGSTGKSKGSRLWKKMFAYFIFNQEEFAKHYHARSNIESTFNMIKAKFNDLLKSKTREAQTNELLLKVLCHNIVVLIHESNELGIETEF